MMSDFTYVDGLQSGTYGRAELEALVAGRLAAVTVTLGFWDTTVEGLESITRYRRLARENADLIEIATSVEDIERIAASGRTALLLGFQNTSPLGGNVRFVELLADLGVRNLQLTYNIQNDVGSSCYEPKDGGLSRFGAEVIGEMNRNGMLVDLSHVGHRTSLDAVHASAQPVAITHANAADLVPHARSVSTELIRAVAGRGGVVGCVLYPKLAGDYASTLDSWCELVLRTVDLVGIDHVGIGSDIGGRTDDASLEWMREGRWTLLPNWGAASASAPGDEDPGWFPSMASFPTIADALAQRGLSHEEVNAITGGNWMSLYRKVLP
jgi:microsomal dipeptidase-like Zn-dependent dipeptidase